MTKWGKSNIGSLLSLLQYVLPIMFDMVIAVAGVEFPIILTAITLISIGWSPSTYISFDWSVTRLAVPLYVTQYIRSPLQLGLAEGYNQYEDDYLNCTAANVQCIIASSILFCFLL